MKDAIKNNRRCSPRIKRLNNPSNKNHKSRNENLKLGNPLQDTTLSNKTKKSMNKNLKLRTPLKEITNNKK